MGNALRCYKVLPARSGARSFSRKAKAFKASCGHFILLFINKYLISSMLPLHIPGQQLMVKSENYEG